MSDIEDTLLRKIKVLNETVWEGRAPNETIEDWLNNFSAEDRIRALYLLSHFVFFGVREMRELLRSMFRDFVRNPTYRSIRDDEPDADWGTVARRYEERLRRTRFLGVGNPSESGTHLLYFFRQENRLPKEAFINAYELFRRDAASGTRELRNPRVDHYVFIDDLCGSGDQAKAYSEQLVGELKTAQPSATVGYLVLFANSRAIEWIRNNTQFDYAEALCVFEASDQCFSPESRILESCPGEVSRDALGEMALRTGMLVWPAHPLGYRNSQLLIGFAHNTPDNSLPIVWGGPNPKAVGWAPIFPRYHKIYDWGQYGS